MLEFQKNAIKLGNEKSLDKLCDFFITRYEKDDVLSRKAQDVLNLILENYQEQTINKRNFDVEAWQDKIVTSQYKSKERFRTNNENEYFRKAYAKFYDNLCEALEGRRVLHTLILNEDRSERANLLLDFMFWIGMSEDKIQKHVSQYLASLIHDPGELFDNQTRLIFAELTPKQQNIVIQCPDIYTALREQMDMGEVIDKKYRILTNLSENLQKINPKRLSGSEYTKINQYVAKNRNSLNTLSVEFETFRGLDAFCKEISLSIPQRKALIDVCVILQGTFSH